VTTVKAQAACRPLDALSGFSRRCQNGLAELPFGGLEATFTQPLYDSESRILFSYVAQTSGDGHFFMNLVLSRNGR